MARHESTKHSNRMLWLLLAICVLTVIPFLGIYDYNTKGEPRESIVSYTMLESGNWILPRNSMEEIAYKPPLFYWLIAAVSAVNEEVNEFTSRLPSAIAYICLTLGVFLFFRGYRGKTMAMVIALVTFTAWEMHRQGFNCRVDMLLTAFIVGALMMFYRWYEKGMRGIPFIAILMMSLATLTKGPIGTLLPCLVTGVFLLLRRVNFFRAFFSMLGYGLLALVLPALWYYAAWQQGGQEFIDLVMEENVGRMTSTMSYESCVQPWYYCIVSLIPGYLPWVIAALLALFGVNWNGKRSYYFSASDDSDKTSFLSRMKEKLHYADSLELFSLTAIVVITIFYCIPQSKRSVYMMPVYPFIAYFLAQMLMWLHKRHPRVWVTYGGFLSVLGLALAMAFVVLKLTRLNPNWFQGSHGFQNYSMAVNLQQAGEIWQWILLAVSVVVLVRWWKNKRSLWEVMAVVLAIYLQVDAVYKPAVLNAKSVKKVAFMVNELAPESDGRLFEFIEAGALAKGDPVHYFELNFYLHDRVGNFHTEKPDSGFLMIGTEDAERWLPRFQNEGYRFNKICDTGQQRVAGQPLQLLKFDKTKAEVPAVSPETP